MSEETRKFLLAVSPNMPEEKIQEYIEKAKEIDKKFQDEMDEIWEEYPEIWCENMEGE